MTGSQITRSVQLTGTRVNAKLKQSREPHKYAALSLTSVIVTHYAGVAARHLNQSETRTLLPLAERSRKLDALPSFKETVGNIQLSIGVRSEKYDQMCWHVEGQENRIKNL